MMRRSLLTRGGHISPDAFVIPILRSVKMLGGEAHADQVFAKMADLIDLTQRELPIADKKQPYYYRGASFITARLRGAKLLEPPTGDGMLRITQAGLVLAGDAVDTSQGAIEGKVGQGYAAKYYATASLSIASNDIYEPSGDGIFSLLGVLVAWIDCVNDLVV